MRNFNLQLAMIERARLVKLEQPSERVSYCADTSRRWAWYQRPELAFVLKALMACAFAILGYVLCDGFAESISYLKW